MRKVFFAYCFFVFFSSLISQMSVEASFFRDKAIEPSNYRNTSDCSVYAIYESNDGKPILQFSDGTKWLIEDAAHGEDPTAILSLWQMNDPVTICPQYISHAKGQFTLQNMENGTFLLASLKSPAGAEFLYLRILSTSLDKSSISLNDGSKWTLNRNMNWKIGQRIVVYKGFFYGEYLLHNVDTKEEKWSFGFLKFHGE